MRKMTFVLGFIFVSLMVFTTSCGSSSSPGDTIQDYYTAMENGDTDKIISMIDNDGEELSEKDREKFVAMVGMAKEQIEKKGGIKSYEILEETISEDGTEATVKTKTIYGDDSEDEGSSKLVNIEGEWKIRFK
ncbi:MAG: hypothetical protein DRI84_04955 [Bacteroidetes bacterium]|nr:MAG: hypothetical protein DRI84_04955 [Bacteroidota bacterium]